MSKPQIAIRIPPLLLQELNRYVNRTGASKTDVVVSAIANYLDCLESVPLTQRIAELELKVQKLEDANARN
ncbi:DNA-binding domain-containing protein [Merismopedia glauca]|uniref:DNA-binding domain-containing protein n=1 Tax=Merismopedia glauca CCAP 1448/3 TaxID=1296344 RepID=A0A2T1C025_9CYAN|nr:DNA-binding domain-containing protein [Merismopedia glauca]PSB01626.1 DNA-binding domain-containing protein [Merismopedia glauca CCAP 1448/3]